MSGGGGWRPSPTWGNQIEATARTTATDATDPATTSTGRAPASAERRNTTAAATITTATSNPTGNIVVATPGGRRPMGEAGP